MKSQKRPLAKSAKRKAHLDIAKDLKISSSRSFDRDSGLVYNELEVARPKSFGHGWISDFSTPNLVRTKQRPNPEGGARKLRDMMLQKLGIESQELTLEAIQYLPWTIGQQIWESICVK